MDTVMKDIYEELDRQVDEASAVEGEDLRKPRRQGAPTTEEQRHITADVEGFEETLSTSRGRGRLWFLTINNPTCSGEEFHNFL